MVISMAKNVDSYDIDAIEKKMQKMSPATANKLGGTNKKAPEKKTESKPQKKTQKKKDA